jgi:integrase/recombinase XerD
MDQSLEWIGCRLLWEGSLRCDNTRKVYVRAVNEFTKACSLPDADRKAVARWVESLRKRKLSPSTINLKLSGISSLFRYASTEYTVRDDQGKEQPLFPYNPAASRTLRPKVERFGKSRALSVSEVKKLLSAIDRESEQGRRDYALILGYVMMGKRNTEWRTARLSQFEYHEDQVLYRWSGKGRKDMLIEVPPPVWDAVMEHVHMSSMEIGQDDFLFCSIKSEAIRPISSSGFGKILRTYARHAGLQGERIYPHMLRHTAAHLRKEAGDSLESIQDFLGHQSPVTTRIYLHKLDGTVDQSWQKVARIIGVEA